MQIDFFSWTTSLNLNSTSLSSPFACRTSGVSKNPYSSAYFFAVICPNSVFLGFLGQEMNLLKNKNDVNRSKMIANYNGLG